MLKCHKFCPYISLCIARDTAWSNLGAESTRQSQLSELKLIFQNIVTSYPKIKILNLWIK